MTKKIFINTFALGLIVLVLCAVLFFGVRYSQVRAETYSSLREEAVFASGGVAMGGEEYLASVGGGRRATWIAEDGSVLYDSEYGKELAAQGDCAEVAAAFRDGEGYSVRRSSSGGTQTMYYAVRCADGTVLRLSTPMAALRDAFTSVSPVLWIFIFVLIMSGIMAFRSAKQLVKPINELDPENPDPEKIYPELAPLADRIIDQNLTIREQIDELAKKQREFAALTENMSEGFVLTDKSGVVLTANSAAHRMISGCVEGDDLGMNPDPAVAEAVRKALSGERVDSVMTTGNRSLGLMVNPVTAHGKTTGAVVLVLDVTEREQRERLRREFSANVSHELKTPLTSISGFAELLMTGSVPPDKVKEFSHDIFRESQRLIVLVNDIIKLSRLDETDSLTEEVEIDLYALAGEVADSLRAAADQAEVTVAVEGVPAIVTGSPRIVDEILYNLCDNAIKYNKKGGSVTVTVAEDDVSASVTVSDTGIGIPPEHRDRIFERFYRVNKSRSHSVAGTGLGLSIVKHAAQLHGARISLESEEGVGTSVTVTFDKKGA